jgi:hypothetical protein
MGISFSNATSHNSRNSKTKTGMPAVRRCAPEGKSAPKPDPSPAKWPSDDLKPGLAVQMGLLWPQPARVPAAASRFRLIG